MPWCSSEKLRPRRLLQLSAPEPTPPWSGAGWGAEVRRSVSRRRSLKAIVSRFPCPLRAESSSAPPRGRALRAPRGRSLHRRIRDQRLGVRHRWRGPARPDLATPPGHASRRDQHGLAHHGQAELSTISAHWLTAALGRRQDTILVAGSHGPPAGVRCRAHVASNRAGRRDHVVYSTSSRWSWPRPGSSERFRRWPTTTNPYLIVSRVCQPGLRSRGQKSHGQHRSHAEALPPNRHLRRQALRGSDLRVASSPPSGSCP